MQTDVPRTELNIELVRNYNLKSTDLSLDVVIFDQSPCIITYSASQTLL